MYIKATQEERKQRNAARAKVSAAIRDGELVKQPCFICGETKAQAHHADYDEPLSVIWLCVPHHYEAHASTRYAAPKTEPIRFMEKINGRWINVAARST